jgi:O-antigen/teichoic acid export membrane protein
MAFNQAYVPWLYRKLNHNNDTTKRKIVTYTYVYFALIFLLALSLGIAAPLILKYLVGKAFRQSAIYVIWIALGSAFQGMYFMVVNYIFYAEKTYLLAIVTFTGAAINVGLNYIFITIYGAIGAAQATSITHLITFLMVWYLANRVLPMPWRLSRKKL